MGNYSPGLYLLSMMDMETGEVINYKVIKQ